LRDGLLHHAGIGVSPGPSGMGVLEATGRIVRESDRRTQRSRLALAACRIHVAR
jgi:hypothetical protein